MTGVLCSFFLFGEKKKGTEKRKAQIGYDYPLRKVMLLFNFRLKSGRFFRTLRLYRFFSAASAALFLFARGKALQSTSTLFVTPILPATRSVDNNLQTAHSTCRSSDTAATFFPAVRAMAGVLLDKSPLRLSEKKTCLHTKATHTELCAS